MIAFTFDAKHVTKKWSTWLAMLSLCAGSGLAAYGLLPQGAQDAFPHWLLSTLAVLAIASPTLIPLATSIQQSNIPKE